MLQPKPYRVRAVLMMGALVLAAAVRAQAPAYLDLFAEASIAYDAQDWPRCAERFVAAAQAAPSDRQAARAFFAAAACSAATGKTDAACGYLDRAAAKGYRDVDRAESNGELAPLRQDPRWKTFFAGVQRRNAAHAGTVNPELAQLYKDDQADRAGTLKDTDWRAVGKRDAERRERVLAIVEKGGAHAADDYYHAAMVFQHGEKPEDYDQAHAWCLEALKLDPDHPAARWLAAASLDRSLMWRNKPQLYGTQFKLVDGKWVLWEVDPTITDEERAKWDVPPLAVAKRRAEKLNAETFEPH
jgi:tetratricopeptide (TPR) repeat protein